MTTKLRTLLLLGLTGLGASLTGCILETSDRSAGGPGYGTGNNCLAYQYFSVEWQVDSGGPTVLSCASVPRSHVELTANTGIVYSVNGTCSAGSWAGFSSSGIPAGTFVTSGALIADADGAVLSTAPVPVASQVAIPYCDVGLLVPFGFTISP